MAEDEMNADGEGASFSQAQLSAISAVVEKLLDKALSERGGGRAVGSGPSVSGAAEVAEPATRGQWSRKQQRDSTW